MLPIWYLYIVFYCLPVLTAQPSGQVLSATSLDSLLQDYAFRALVRPRTGEIYDGVVPSNLTGVKVSALRLRSGSLKRKGFSGYKEFDIPIGVVEHPYVERLVLVYHNLANWSSLYYPLPGYTYLTPILGLLAYDASNLSAKNLQALDLVTSQDPILVRFSNVLPAGPQGVSPKCIYFGLDGSVEFNNVINQSVCSGTKQGHFSIGAEFNAPVPAPAPAPVPSPAGGGGGNRGGGHKNSRKVWIIVGSVVGGVLLVVLLCILFACLRKYRRKRSLHRMEEAADRGEPLVMANVGRTKAPVASETRTKPSLEDDYMP
ncbi:OLC1v1006484C1 [Oldenlandia corymbosa var. corymbosa]|uniref:OLC1v1006484C1 n=1 Tax=Oldenlandia corymbosa var. corymbosa TaxID=529605 RepID=A0AAV1DH73_OLDCO|nr:OLC1v1006484C1 [Oldenlandia corymbosa var. corymbosa]